MNFGMSYSMWSAILCLVHFSCEINAQCSGNGLNNECACNFINACTWNPSLQRFNPFGGSASDLRKLIPNLSHLAKSPLQVAEICEPGSFGILYDCINRIPVAATIVMTAQQYSSSYYRPNKSFKQSSKIPGNIQQDDFDYDDALQRVPCIETPFTLNNYYVAHDWYAALTRKNPVAPYTVPCPATPPKSVIHRGHLVAASYGRGTPGRIAKTFVYTNAVPQFGIENSGSWNSFEQKLIKWANINCAGAPLNVITGSIPSTYGRNSPRFFGQAGFSTYEGRSFKFPRKQPYRVNVPSFLWTAACCHSSSPSSTKSTAFFAPNMPGRNLVRSIELSRLFAEVQAPHVDLFPGIPGCSDDANYILVL